MLDLLWIPIIWAIVEHHFNCSNAYTILLLLVVEGLRKWMFVSSYWNVNYGYLNKKLGIVEKVNKLLLRRWFNWSKCYQFRSTIDFLLTFKYQ